VKNDTSRYLVIRLQRSIRPRIRSRAGRVGSFLAPFARDREQLEGTEFNDNLPSSRRRERRRAIVSAAAGGQSQLDRRLHGKSSSYVEPMRG